MGKKKITKMPLNVFLATTGESSSWADEMELPTAPAAEASRSISHNARNFNCENEIRPTLADLPTRPPFTAYMANFPFSASETDIADFFESCAVVQVRIPIDYESKKPKGFSYIEFKDRDSLFKALSFHGSDFNGRTVRINVAEQREQDTEKSANNWRRGGSSPSIANEAPKASDTASNWRRAAPVTPISREGDFSLRPSNNRFHGPGERSSHASNQAESVSNWRSGAGPRTTSNADSDAFGARRSDNNSTTASVPSGERKKLVLQPRSKPVN